MMHVEQPRFVLVPPLEMHGLPLQQETAGLLAQDADPVGRDAAVRLVPLALGVLKEILVGGGRGHCSGPVSTSIQSNNSWGQLPFPHPVSLLVVAWQLPPALRPEPRPQWHHECSDCPLFAALLPLQVQKNQVGYPRGI